MKKIFAIALATVLSTVAIANLSSAPAHPTSSKQATNSAATEVTFSEQTFKALQAENASILIDVSATWCGTCKKQHQVMKEYFAKNRDSKIHVLTVDYDDQKEWVRYFKAPRQSTLVLYKGKTELNRVIAQTNKDKLFEFMEQGEI